jgi:hypothetical protein
MKALSEHPYRLPRAGPVLQRPRTPRPGEGEPAVTEVQLSGEADGCQEHHRARRRDDAASRSWALGEGA